MTKEKKLINDTILYGIANFGTSFLSFLMLPLYTKYFSTSEYGLWDLIVTTTTLLTPIISFELVAAVYRWLLDEKEVNEKKKIITTGALIIIRNIIIFNTVSIIAIRLYNIQYGWLALILINIMLISGFMQQTARGLGKNVLFASLGIIQSVIIVVLNLFFILKLEFRVEALFYSSMIAGIIVIVFAWIKMNFSQYIHFKAYSQKMKKEFLKYSIPIIPGAVSWWVMTMSDRYMITLYLGLEYNGIFAVASKIPALLMLISSIFFLAWKDSAITEFNSPDKNEYYSDVFRHFFRLMATSLVCLTLLTKPILALFISDAFYDSWKYICILLLGALFNAFSLFWSAGYHGAKKTNVILVTSLIGAIINILINFIFIPFIGLYAVVISTVVAFLVTWMIRILYAKPYFKIKLNYKDFLILFPLIIVAIVIPFVVGTVGIIVSVGLSGMLFLGWNRHVLKIISSTLLKKKNKKSYSNYS